MADKPKNKMSRRNFLRNAAMGAATVGALAAAPSVLGLTENVGADTSFGEAGVPLMAYVKDASTGTVEIVHLLAAGEMAWPVFAGLPVPTTIRQNPKSRSV